MESQPENSKKPDGQAKEQAKEEAKAYQDKRIVFERVGFRYHRNAEVLSDIHFSLAPGSANFVTGPSGAGKSTLLKLVYLHMRPSRGLITMFGQDISLLKPSDIPSFKRRMGIVLQEFTLIEHLNVYENVALPLRMSGQAQADYAENVISLLKWVGLGHRLRALPETLSGGEKQRAAIARAVITRPEILIADEPTGNVDDEMARRLLRLFAELNRLGTTLLIATHNTELIFDNANVFRLDNAHLIKERTRS